MKVYFFKLQQWAVKFEVIKVISFYHFQRGFLVIWRDPRGGLAWRTLLFFEFFFFKVERCHLQNFIILTMLIYDKFGTCFGNDLGKDTTNTHMYTLSGTNIRHAHGSFEGDVPFAKVEDVPWRITRLKGNNDGWMHLGVYGNAKLSWRYDTKNNFHINGFRVGFMLGDFFYEMIGTGQKPCWRVMKNQIAMCLLLGWSCMNNFVWWLHHY